MALPPLRSLRGRWPRQAPLSVVPCRPVAARGGLALIVRPSQVATRERASRFVDDQRLTAQFTNCQCACGCSARLLSIYSRTVGYCADCHLSGRCMK